MDGGDGDGDGAVDVIMYASVLGRTLMVDPYNLAFGEVASREDVTNLVTAGNARPRMAAVLAQPHATMYFSRAANQPWDRVVDLWDTNSVQVVRAWVRSGEGWKRDGVIEGRPFLADPAWLAATDTELPAAQQAMINIVGEKNVKIDLATRVPDVASWDNPGVFSPERLAGGELFFRVASDQGTALVVSTSPRVSVNTEGEAIAGMLAARKILPLFEMVQTADGRTWMVYDFNADGKPEVAQCQIGGRFVELRAENGGVLTEVGTSPAKTFLWKEYEDESHRSAVRKVLEGLVKEEFVQK